MRKIVRVRVRELMAILFARIPRPDVTDFDDQVLRIFGTTSVRRPPQALLGAPSSLAARAPLPPSALCGRFFPWGYPCGAPDFPGLRGLQAQLFASRVQHSSASGGSKMRAPPLLSC